jgi:type IV pilus assembly protein PilB
MQRYSVTSDAPRTPLSSPDPDPEIAQSWDANNDGQTDVPVTSQRVAPTHPTQATHQQPAHAPHPQHPAPARPAQAARPQRTSATDDAHHDSALFVRGVLNEAIRRGASDVHLEPMNEFYRIRFRVDGVLQEFTRRPGEEYEMILNTIKVLSDMDIAEHILPQDGHIELVLQQVDEHVPVQDRTSASSNAPTESESPKAESRYYDIRVSVFPSVNGEVVVMRVLSRTDALLSVEELGMDTDSLQKLRQILLTSYGMILVTGPTGSGKTTTLYSILQELKSDDKNIVTLEDPIEFHLSWLRQCEIREGRGFTFERAMTSILRQDPDVLMVGEIRDPHTAEYAVRSALVGRIVGSTIHANTAIGTIARLIDLGIPRSILAHSINGIIAQRLVRKTCEHCRVEYQPLPLALAHFGLQEMPGPFYKGAGCEVCNSTGFKGRTGLFSVMVLDDTIRSLIFDQRPLAEIQDFAINQGMRTLKMDAATKILAGITTVEEAARVV